MSERTNEMTDETSILILFILDLIYRNDTIIGKEWGEFEDEVKFRSRFFPKGVLLTRVKELAEIAKRKISKGTILYRARLYKSSYEFAQKEMEIVLHELQNSYPDMNLSKDDLYNKERIAFLLQISGEDIYRKISMVKGEASFYGYSEKESDVPRKLGAVGRANAKNVPFLYAAEEKETAIMEAQPKLGQEVSICEIELTRDINVFDFYYDMGNIKEGDYSKAMDLGALSSCFSRPNYKDDFEYLPTQYLCEYIRELGFDGIRFCSSVKSGGVNMVIFDTEPESKPYIICNSKVVKITDIKVSYNQIIPPED